MPYSHRRGSGLLSRAVKAGLLVTLVAAVATCASAVAPATASAAPCPVNPGNATAWIGGSGSFHTDANWTNGTPTGACAVTIAPAGSPVITMTGGANMTSLTLGGVGSTPTLVISAESPNTNLSATGTGIDIAAGASVVLTCPPSPGGCLGGAAGGSGLNALSSTIDNAGTIKVDAASGSGASITGGIENTGTIDIDQTTTHMWGTLRNQGSVTVADGKLLRSTTSHCGDSAGTIFKSDTGGTLVGEGTGALEAVNYDQGNGSASGSNPVLKPCGSLTYTGNGASKVRATGGFALSGEMHPGQSLTISAESANTNATLTGPFTNGGSIALTCAAGGCGGSGVGFNAAGNVFTNSGTFTVDAGSGTGAGLSSGGGGTILNTGTMRFDQSAYISGIAVNKGAIEIADDKEVNSSGSSCGDTGASLKNDVGGEIDATGSGRLRVLNYEQGAGTTSGSAPVQIPCGTLKYTGTGASTVQLNGGVSITGNVASGQTLRLVNGSSPAPAFTNAGTIVFDPSGSASLDTSALTNTGRLTGIGTVNGSVDNQSGTVAPGAGLGTLTVNGGYSQGAGGTLEIYVEGTGAGQFDKLAVGGSATLGGTLALKPSADYAAAAAPGDSAQVLAYGGSRTNPFAATTVTPALACPNVFTASYADAARNVAAVVADGGADCDGGGGDGGGGSGGGPGGGSGGGGAGGGGGTVTPPAVVRPDTSLSKRPRATVSTRKKKVKVTFKFASTVAGARFQCKLDKKPFAACSSPKSYRVARGRHSFSVRAVGAGGATDTTPATFSFKVVKKKR